MDESQQQNGQEVSPFITKAIVCPLCELSSPQRRIKRHLYQEQKRDLDFRPLSYQWKGKGLAVQHPLIHFLWHCPGCRFTAWPGVWENPIRGLNLTMAKYRAVLQGPPSQDLAAPKVQELLLQGLSWPEVDFDQGLRLRLSWLYRELDERPELSPTAGRLAQLAQRLAPLWPEAPLDDTGALRAAVAFYEIGATDASAVEDVGELCNLLLLITRIHIKLRQFDQARLYWSKASELTRNLDMRKQQLEGAYYQLEQRTKSDARAVAEMARKQQDDVSAHIVELDSKVRGMRQKVRQVRDVLEDEMDAPPPSRAVAPEAPAEEILDLDLSLKPKKKRLRDYFK